MKSVFSKVVTIWLTIVLLLGAVVGINVLAAGEEQNAAAGEYFAPMTMKGIPAGLEVCFTVTPYVVCTDGTIVCAAPATYLVNAN